MSGDEPDAEFDFNESYVGTPPWDIGRPQPALVELETSGVIEGTILDVGCGTGENALHYASQGHCVLGVDAAINAIEKARAKAAHRGLSDRARFTVHDTFDLASLGEQFDTITDCGLFHMFGPEDAVAYAESLKTALRSDGRYVMLGFSERDGRIGPSTNETLIRKAFAVDWKIEEIRETTFETTDPATYNHHALLVVVRNV
ncbi:class I SAM-dependent methyltransferase [Haladaptatus sp. DJG-WS-42]|uniref:SAM-dependent methyltransferase n=1 Tax=Haladaptatus sp. DJG-WS-42 TaxID=3120516 RepID=UPI0030D3D22F